MGSPLGTRATAAHERILRLVADPPGPEELIHEVAGRVRRIVPHDRGAWTTIDPETLLETSTVVADPDKDCFLDLEIAAAELAGADVNRFDDLDRTGQAAASLAVATGGDLGASARHRTVLSPRALGDELRALARSGGATWATATLVRGDDAPAFSAEETRYVGAVATLLGHGLRRALARTALAAPAGDAGTVIVGPDGRLEAATDAARRWLRLVPSPYGDDHLPPAVELLVVRAQALAGGAAPGRPARGRIRVGDAGWLTASADVLHGATDAPPRVAVTIRPADRADLLPLTLDLHGLTPREREVTTLLLAAHPTDAIARRLGVSPHTVRDHVKAVLTKLDVGSRHELTARLTGVAA